MERNIFERLRAGEAVDMQTPEYADAVAEMMRCATLCHTINGAVPGTDEVRRSIAALFGDGMPEDSNILPPFQVDYACSVSLGHHVFINHSLTMMAAGGITIGDGTMIGPNVQLLTDNHDFHNRMVLLCKPINIGKNVWVGAGATVLPGVTIGDNAVVGSCAVVTKDVPENAIVVGNPARVVRTIE
ncbi:MAG: sugar O-acetyltransferase [Prevotella sp.]|jgi:acetyltransferase-like isoleucine patch superfamily enzyme